MLFFSMIFNGHLDSNIIINPLSHDGVHIYTNDGLRKSVVSNNIIAQHAIANIRVSGEYTRSAYTYLYQNTLDDAQNGLRVESFSTVYMSNSIISNHSIWDVYFGGTMMSINISYTLFFNNEENGSWPFVTHPIPSGDPRYVNAAGGNYHILPDSAARDVAGSIGYDTDFEGDARPLGSGVTPYDVGADEFWWKSYIPVVYDPWIPLVP